MKLESDSVVIDDSSLDIELLVHEPTELDEDVSILEDS